MGSLILFKMEVKHTKCMLLDLCLHFQMGRNYHRTQVRFLFQLILQDIVVLGLVGYII